jgi:predicted nucleic acid-binding protein
VIVADSTLAAALLLPSRHAEEAERVLVRDSQWAAPLVWRTDFERILAHGVRRGLISLSGAGRVLERAARLYRGREYAVPPAEVLALSNSCSATAGACEYAVLAYALGLQLVTVDEGVLSAFADVAVRPVDFT